MMQIYANMTIYMIDKMINVVKISVSKSNYLPYFTPQCHRWPRGAPEKKASKRRPLVKPTPQMFRRWRSSSGHITPWGQVLLSFYSFLFFTDLHISSPYLHISSPYLHISSPYLHISSHPTFCMILHDAAWLCDAALTLEVEPFGTRQNWQSPTRL
jgi:hypothetical protein